MKVWIVEIECIYIDNSNEIIGVFSTKEKAEVALLKWLRECDEPALSYEQYSNMDPDDKNYFAYINDFILDAE